MSQWSVSLIRPTTYCLLQQGHFYNLGLVTIQSPKWAHGEARWPGKPGWTARLINDSVICIAAPAGVIGIQAKVILTSQGLSTLCNRVLRPWLVRMAEVSLAKEFKVLIGLARYAGDLLDYLHHAQRNNKIGPSGACQTCGKTHETLHQPCSYAWYKI